MDRFVTGKDSLSIWLNVKVNFCFSLSAGSKDHVEVQGEILEGLVARMVSHESSKHMEQVLRDYPPPPLNGGELIIFYGHVSFVQEIETVFLHCASLGSTSKWFIVKAK